MVVMCLQCRVPRPRHVVGLATATVGAAETCVVVLPETACLDGVEATTARLFLDSGKHQGLSETTNHCALMLLITSDSCQAR